MVYCFAKAPWNILWRAGVVFVGKPGWNHRWSRRQVMASPVSESRGFVRQGPWCPFFLGPWWPVVDWHWQAKQSVIKAPWPWPFEDLWSKPHTFFDRPVPIILSTRGRAWFSSLFSMTLTPSSSLCDSGDLWPWSLLQYSSPAHHLPRWLQLKTGTVMTHSCLNNGFMSPLRTF